MIKRFCFLMCVLASQSLQGQNGPTFSHFMFNKSYWNPSLVSIDGGSSVSFISRGQWAGYETSFEQQGGAPVTQFLNYSTLMDIKGLPIGLGGSLMYDQLGPVTNTELHLSIAYHKDFSRGKISFGVSPRFINRKLDFGQLVAVNPEDLIESGSILEQQFDLSAGVSFVANDFGVSLGVNNILTPEFEFIDGGSSGQNGELMEYVLMADYRYLVNLNTVIQPSVLVHGNFAYLTYDINVRVIYQTKIWAGLSYRDGEAMSLLLGYSFLEDQSLEVGYAFDLVIDNQSAKQPTSHELYLRYNLPTLNSRSKKIIRTPRFRF
ncbi:MAG: PorP/SprF family type IX secretion system membrane protein [Reichenbachiella sp.]